MPFFSRSKDFEISGGTFIDKSVVHQVVNYFPGRHIGIDTLLKASEPEATYNSTSRSLAPRCHPGTREKFIKDLLQWAAPTTLSANPPPLSWLKGRAGVGKSAIAQTCVERLMSMSVPCVAFFFSINSRNDPARLFPTLAYQLSLILPAYHTILDKKISPDTSLLSRPLRAQFQELILEPLQQLNRERGIIQERISIFIDGLDECRDTEAQSEIVEIAADALCKGSTLPLRWAFFSRPESHIEATFSQRNIAAITTIIDLPISRGDDGEIERFLSDGFQKLLRRRNMPKKYPWPSAKDMKALVDAADGLFIYADSALKFIDDPKWSEPQEALSLVLESARNAFGHAPESVESPLPFAELDALYLLIMDKIPSVRLPHAMLLLTLIYLEGTSRDWFGSPGPGIFMQANCLGFSQFQYRAICGDLSSVMHLRDAPLQTLALGSNALIRRFKKTFKGFGGSRYLIEQREGGASSFHHKSFVDFLGDQNRSKKYCVSTPSAYANLFIHLSDVLVGYCSGLKINGLKLVLRNDSSAPQPMVPFPHIYQYVNLLLPVIVINHLSDLWMDASPWVQYTNDNAVLYTKIASWDFKGIYYARRYVHQHGQNFVIRNFRWGCKVQIECVGQVELLILRDFAKFDVLMFKRMIDDQIQGGVLQSVDYAQHFPEDQNREKGLFILGREERSVYWYWEIDFIAKVYREFHSPDLTEGTEAFMKKFPKPDGRSTINAS
ncbi:hypothetical protein NP233_g689 [Leucocoprinus birnbaumii]|uniref:Nephrocystin 3-like N-terminal domain-containing protein n=1 Tax=Leucocoprinus birnbaumii TaxID=56174 RepID=A0AAD5W3S2_9AGAR|nr:hypothetical protein NP233_g689 [Leucocoprinus birnbaumii]